MQHEVSQYESIDQLVVFVRSDANPVGVFKGFCPPEICAAAARACNAYADETGSQLLDRFEITRSTMRDDIHPAASKVDRVFRTYFILPQDADPLYAKVKPLFDIMYAAQDAIGEVTRQTIDMERFADSTGRPQIIHYPSGGGFFADHTHPRYPTNYGLIVNITKRGTDYNAGSTYFFADGERIDIDKDHDIGDLCLFRFDLLHGVGPVDPEDDLDFDNHRGRKSAILPILSPRDGAYPGTNVKSGT